MRKSIRMYLLSMAVFGTIAPFARWISVSSGELALYRGDTVLGGGTILRALGTAAP